MSIAHRFNKFNYFFKKSGRRYIFWTVGLKQQ
nr:MAG TPA: hypothetical protein [Caudoviricetes sp.]